MPYGLIFFLLVKLIIYLLRDEPEVLAGNTMPDVEYYVNGELIDRGHVDHCKKLLNLPAEGPLAEKDITAAYYRVYDDLAKIREQMPVMIDIAGLKAAKCYLLDRWAYMAHLN